MAVTKSHDNSGHPNGTRRDLLVQFNNLVTKFEALLAKLDADAGVTDTNYTTLLNGASSGGASKIGNQDGVAISS